MRERAAEAVQQRNPVMAAGFLDAALRIEDWVRKSAPARRTSCRLALRRRNPVE